MDKTFDEQALEIVRECIAADDMPDDMPTVDYPYYKDMNLLEFARRIRAAVLAEGGAREPVAEVVAMYGGSGGMTRMLPNVKTPPIGTKLYAASIAPPSDLVALLREALEVLPGRGNLRRRIIQTIGEPIAPPPAGPASPLLPGLERAIHVVELTAWEHDVPPFDQHLIVDAIHAEISRLKG